MIAPREEDKMATEGYVQVNAIVCGAVEKSNTTNHTGATRHIFNDVKYFHDYSPFDTPLTVHGFGSDLLTLALGKGTIKMECSYDGVERVFSASNALHIPSARCNLLLSGPMLDRKGVSTMTGKGKITYLNSANVPFATGNIMNDLYQMDVKLVESGETGANVDLIASAGIGPAATFPELIAGMVPSIASLFGSGNESEENQVLGFSTV